MVARMNIPYGSIMAQLRQRQVDEANAKRQKEQQKAALTKSLVTLGGLAAGALTGGLGLPIAGIAAGGTGGALTGAGIGASAGGLLGSAASGTPMGMGEVMGGLNLAGGIYNQGQKVKASEGLDAAREALTMKRMDDLGYTAITYEGEDAALADDVMIGKQPFTQKGIPRGVYDVTRTREIDGIKETVKSTQSSDPFAEPVTATAPKLAPRPPRQDHILGSSGIINATGIPGFTDPVPEGGIGGPTVGTVKDGYRYIGGDPNDPTSWQLI